MFECLLIQSEATFSDLSPFVKGDCVDPVTSFLTDACEVYPTDNSVTVLIIVTLLRYVG